MSKTSKKTTKVVPIRKQPRKPRALRPFWVTAHVSGMKTLPAFGPKGDGKFDLNIFTRGPGGESVHTLKVEGRVGPDGTPRLYVTSYLSPEQVTLGFDGTVQWPGNVMSCPTCGQDTAKTACDECGADIPEGAETINRCHTEACSLHPASVTHRRGP